MNTLGKDKGHVKFAGSEFAGVRTMPMSAAKLAAGKALYLVQESVSLAPRDIRKPIFVLVHSSQFGKILEPDVFA